jgi:hypothetical protein
VLELICAVGSGALQLGHAAGDAESFAVAVNGGDSAASTLAGFAFERPVLRGRCTVRWSVMPAAGFGGAAARSLSVAMSCSAAVGTGFIALGVSGQSAARLQGRILVGTNPMVGARVVIGVDEQLNPGLPAVGEYVISSAALSGISLASSVSGASGWFRPGSGASNGTTLRFSGASIADMTLLPPDVGPTSDPPSVVLKDESGSSPDSAEGLVLVRAAAAGASLLLWLLSVTAFRTTKQPEALAVSGVTGATVDLVCALAVLSAACAALAPGVWSASDSPACWTYLLLAVSASGATPFASRLLHLSARLYRVNILVEARSDTGLAVCCYRWMDMLSSRRAGPALVVSASIAAASAVAATGGCNAGSAGPGGAVILVLIFVAGVVVHAPVLKSSLSVVVAVPITDAFLLRQSLLRTSALLGIGLVAFSSAVAVGAALHLDIAQVVAIAFTALLPFAMLVQVPLLLIPAARIALSDTRLLKYRLVRGLSAAGLARSPTGRSVMTTNLEQFEAFLLSTEGCEAFSASPCC